MKSPRRLDFLYSNLTKAIWYVLVLGWALIRTFAVKTVFAENGVNPWLYLAIDLLASLPYARYTHQLVISYLEKDRQKFKKAAIISIASFYAPDIYILLVAREVPRAVYLGFFLVLALFSIFAVLGIYRKVKPRPHK